MSSTSSHKDLCYLALCALTLVGSIAWCRHAKHKLESANKSTSARKYKVGVGIGVVVFKEATGQILLGLRKNAHGENTWALPGGWLEHGEDFITCALRELEEETGFTAKDLGAPSVIDVAPSNNVFSESVHSVTVFVKVPLISSAEPKLIEPDKCERWAWFNSRTREWPSPLFLPAQYLFITRGFSV